LMRTEERRGTVCFVEQPDVDDLSLRHFGFTLVDKSPIGADATEYFLTTLPKVIGEREIDGYI